MPTSSPTATTPQAPPVDRRARRLARAVPRALGRALRAPSGRKGLWLGSLALVALVRLGLWTAPLGRLQSLVARLGRGRFSEPLAKQEMAPPLGSEPPALSVALGAQEHELRWAIAHMARLVPGASCLTQALALQVLLGRRGLGSRLCIGVRKAGARGFEAHAWVERGGRVLIGGQEQARQDERWTPLTAWDFEPTALSSREVPGCGRPA